MYRVSLLLNTSAQLSIRAPAHKRVRARSLFTFKCYCESRHMPRSFILLLASCNFPGFPGLFVYTLHRWFLDSEIKHQKSPVFAFIDSYVIYFPLKKNAESFFSQIS